GGGEVEMGRGRVAFERVQPPRSEMHLVDRHRLRPGARAGAPLQPVAVGPAVARAEDDRARAWRLLGPRGERVGLQKQRTVLAADLELVDDALCELGYEELPDPGRAEAAHRMDAAVPAVEVADDADRAGTRRPDGKRRPRDTVQLARVGAQHALKLLVAALARQMEVELADGGQKRVRVVLDDGLPVRIAQLELVAGRLGDPLERAPRQAFH